MMGHFRSGGETTKRTRHIGDFTRWKEHDAYQKALDRLLRDLQVERKRYRRTQLTGYPRHSHDNQLRMRLTNASSRAPSNLGAETIWAMSV